ncbi:MAG: Uma2 family endonuclease [Deltaproteobacteria bacterium]|nr:MAG: Uma2 family endonuclease [Deltaproteobacteria bacterium]
MLGPVTTARRRATYDDLIAVPDNLVAEIIDGELVTSPRPASPHALAATRIGTDLGGPFDRPPGGGLPGGWWLLFEPELRLGEDVIVPDFAGWRRDRMPVLPNVVGFTQPPDWVCEVVSPRTGAIDRGRKMRIYARERVGHLWMVDPLARTLEIYRLEADRWIVASTHAASERVRPEPFDAMELDIGRWWLES